MLKSVAEQGTLKAASEQIYKSQAAISKAIKQLEQDLGVILFNREAYRLTLTIEGERIYHLALPLLKKSAEISSLGKHFNAGNESHLTISIASSFDLSVIFPILKVIQTQFPQTNIIIQTLNLSGALEAVQSQKADIAITPVMPATLNDSKLDFIKISQGRSVKVAAPSLIVQYPKLEYASQLENEYQIIVQDSGSGSKNQQFSSVAGQRKWFVNDIHTKLQLILQGMGWGGMPQHQITDHLANGTLETIFLKDLKTYYPLDFYAIKLNEKLNGPVMSKLWQALVDFNNSTKS